MDQDAKWNPKEQRKRHHGSYNVVSKKLPKGVDVQFVDKVPQTLHHILDLLHTLSLRTWSINVSVQQQFSCVGSEMEVTHCSIAKAHGAWFSFTQEQEVTTLVLIRDANTTTIAATNLT